MTPMIEIEKLKDGVYEKVMSRRFAEVLREALAEDQVRAEEEDVDAEEAVGYLSSYLQRVIRLCLKDIADRDEENSVDHQLALTNELIASLAKKTEEKKEDSKTSTKTDAPKKEDKDKFNKTKAEMIKKLNLLKNKK